jgi:hypothetical protein
LEKVSTLQTENATASMPDYNIRHKRHHKHNMANIYSKKFSSAKKEYNLSDEKLRLELGFKCSAANEDVKLYRS